MDTYLGYSQIKMRKEDEEVTSFIMEQGMFCFQIMPFGLKNAGATFQRLMDKTFKSQIRSNLKVYDDDMLVK